MQQDLYFDFFIGICKFSLMSLTHLQLAVSSLKESSLFYQKILGFHSVFIDRCIEFLRDENGFELVLNESEPVVKMPDWFHIGRVCQAEDEVQEIWRLANEMKCPIHKPLTNREDAIFFYCLDPNGYPIEIYFDKVPPQDVVRPIPTLPKTSTE